MLHGSLSSEKSLSAATSSHLEIIRSLTEKFISVPKIDRSSIAARVAMGAVASYCTYYFYTKISLNSRDEEGNTSLHDAVIRGDLNAAQNLLQANSAIGFLKPKADVNARNKVGDTPLHLAARYNMRDFAKTLMENGADAFLENDAGETPCSYAEMFISDDTRIALGISVVKGLEHQKKI